MGAWQAAGTDRAGHWTLAWQDGLMAGTPRVVVAVYESGVDCHDPAAVMAKLLELAANGELVLL